MSQTDKLPIAQAVKSSWKFAAASWMPVLPVFLIKSLVTAGFVSSVGSATQANGLLVLLGLLMVLFLEIASMTLMLRLAVRAEYEGFLGIQLGPDEGRMVLAQLLFGFLMWLVFLIVGFVVFALASAYLSTTIPDIAAIQNDEEAFLKAVVSAFQTPAGTIVAVIMAIAFLFPILLIVSRLVTFPAAVIAERRIMIFDTWAWTKGYSLQIMLALVAACLPFFALVHGGQYIVSVIIGLDAGFLITGDELMSASRMQAFVVLFMAGMLSMPVNLVFSGLSAFMYNGFKPR